MSCVPWNKCKKKKKSLKSVFFPQIFIYLFHFLLHSLSKFWGSIDKVFPRMKFTLIPTQLGCLNKTFLFSFFIKKRIIKENFCLYIKTYFSVWQKMGYYLKTFFLFDLGSFDEFLDVICKFVLNTRRKRNSYCLIMLICHPHSIFNWIWIFISILILC